MNLIDFQDNKAPDWKLENPKKKARDGLQMSDTVKNDYIHVFPDRQDLVNPPVGPHAKHRNPEIPNHYYPQNYYGVAGNEICLPNLKPRNSSRSPGKSRGKILPTSILDTSQELSIDMMDRINSPERPEACRNVPRISSDFHAYSKVVTKPSKTSIPESRRNLEDCSVIFKTNKETIPNLDDSDDMNVAMVIQTLERNIARSEAIRHKQKGGLFMNFGRKGTRKSSGRNQDSDTLSLECSSAKVEQPMYFEEPKDLRSKLLGNPVDSNRTIYYSFDKQDSLSYSEKLKSDKFSLQGDKPQAQLQPHKDGRKSLGVDMYSNNRYPLQTNIDPNGGKRKLTPPKLNLARIDEECSSVRTLIKIGDVNTIDDLRITEAKKSSRNTQPQTGTTDLSKFGKFSSSITKADGPGLNNQRPKTLSQQFIPNIQSHETESNHRGHKARTLSLVPKLQSSDNFILCINCNDLLPASTVDKHSTYCNETMMAPEEITGELVIDANKPQLSLEKCNFRLAFIKTLLEKNLKNLKGQLDFKLLTINDAETVFSEVTLANKLIEEARRNDKIISKLSLDINSLKNLKEDLEPYLDVTLVGIIMLNLRLAAEFCKQKQKALGLISRQSQTIEESGRIYDDTKEASLNIPKVEFERVRNFSLASPQSTISKNYPSHPSYNSHSSRGSTLPSNRVLGEHRHAFSGDVRYLLGGSK